jgi:aryl-alcohol dehydrogenase-like predicted oxidoreductase
MTKRKLGNSDLEITPIGVGAWAMGGGGWAFTWGPQDDNESIASIRAALDKGINWIDTAAVYGLGHSEEVVARAIEGISPRPYVFTKCARVWDEQGKIGKRLKAESIRAECEASLRRLKLDCVDLYQIHWPEPDEDIEEGWSTLVKLREEGKARWIGVSNFSVAQLQRIAKIAPVTSLQPPYSMLVRGAEEELLPYALERGVGVISYSPMRNGLLSGGMSKERIAAFAADDFRHRVPDFQEPALTRNLRVADLLKTIGQRHGRTAGEVAIAWTLRNPAITGAIVGMRSPKQVDGVIGALEFRLTAQETGEIESFLTKTAASAAQ